MRNFKNHYARLFFVDQDDNINWRLNNLHVNYCNLRNIRPSDIYTYPDKFVENLKKAINKFDNDKVIFVENLKKVKDFQKIFAQYSYMVDDVTMVDYIKSSENISSEDFYELTDSEKQELKTSFIKLSIDAHQMLMFRESKDIINIAAFRACIDLFPESFLKNKIIINLTDQMLDNLKDMSVSAIPMKNFIEEEAARTSPNSQSFLINEDSLNLLDLINADATITKNISFAHYFEKTKNTLDNIIN